MLVTDEWTFPTTEGTATVADRRLRIAGSMGRLARSKWRDSWTENDAGRRLLFLVSVAGSLGFLYRVAVSSRAVLAGRTEAASLVVLGIFTLAVLAVAYRTTRTKSVSLRAVETVRRVDHDRLRVEFEDDARGVLDIETPTEKDADEAVEILRLRGVSVTDATDAEEVAAPGFRKRLRAKRE